MTPDQVALVQQSFAKVAPIADEAAILFYDRLGASWTPDVASAWTEAWRTLSGFMIGEAYDPSAQAAE